MKLISIKHGPKLWKKITISEFSAECMFHRYCCPRNIGITNVPDQEIEKIIPLYVKTHLYENTKNTFGFCGSINVELFLHNEKLGSFLVIKLFWIVFKSLGTKWSYFGAKMNSCGIDRHVFDQKWGFNLNHKHKSNGRGKSALDPKSTWTGWTSHLKVLF